MKYFESSIMPNDEFHTQVRTCGDRQMLFFFKLYTEK